MNQKMSFDDILIEWGYRVHNGQPNPKDTNHLHHLSQILYENGWPYEVIDGLMQNLLEVDIVKNKDSGNVYPVQTHNPDTQDLVTKDASDDEIEKVKKGEKPSDDKPKKKKTSIVSGDTSEGDNQVKNDMFKYGYTGYQKATDMKPAPGGAGSAFNEIVSGEGVHILNENPDMTEEELARDMYEKTKDTKLGQEQALTPGTGKAPDGIENKKLWSKCIVSARSAKKKHERTQKRVKRLQEEKKFGNSQKTLTFYGAKDSIDAQVKSVENANKVILPNGQEVDKEDAKTFIKAGGGGMNPSDTGTFVEDDKGNLLIQFHSDKTATSDIQDNSTIIQEGENYKSYIDKSDIPDDKKQKAKKIVDEISEKINDIEENYNNQAIPIAKRLTELPIKDQIDIIEKDKGTLKKNIDTALFGKGGLLKKQFKDYLPDDKSIDELTPQEKYEMIRKLVADGKGKTNETKVINKVSLTLQKDNPDIDGIDVRKNLSLQRERVVNLQRERVNQLNKSNPGFGTSMEAEEASRAFHFTMMDYPPKEYEEGNPESIMGASMDVNMGGNIVDGEVLKGCLNVKDSKDFKDNFKLEESDELQYADKEKTIVTGKRVFTYIVDKDNNRTEVGYKTYRSKEGATGKTNNTMTYSTDMQNCFKGKK